MNKLLITTSEDSTLIIRQSTRTFIVSPQGSKLLINGVPYE